MNHENSTQGNKSKTMFLLLPRHFVILVSVFGTGGNSDKCTAASSPHPRWEEEVAAAMSVRQQTIPRQTQQHGGAEQQRCDAAADFLNRGGGSSSSYSGAMRANLPRFFRDGGRDEAAGASGRVSARRG